MSQAKTSSTSSPSDPDDLDLDEIVENMLLAEKAEASRYVWGEEVGAAPCFRVHHGSLVHPFLVVSSHEAPCESLKL